MTPSRTALRTGPFEVVPAIVAHRGFGRGTVDGFQENTLAAFQHAVRCGVDWLEVDVRRCADDGLFVLHHPTLTPGLNPAMNGLAGGGSAMNGSAMNGLESAPDAGPFVVDLTSAQLRAAGVLALDDLLAAIPSDVGVVFDIKTSLEDALRPPGLTTTGLLLPVLARERDRRPLVVTSFDPAGLLLVGERLPGVARGLLTWVSFPLRKAIPTAAQLGLEAVSVHWRSFAANGTDPAPRHRETSYSIDIAHRAGLQVLAWCPGVERGAELLAAGVDALIVDDVPGALKLSS